MYAHFYSENPIPNLEARTIGLAALSEKHSGLSFTQSEDQYRAVGLTTYPETRDAKWERVRKNFRDMKEQFARK